MSLVRISESVYLAKGPIASLGASDIDFLKSEVSKISLGRIRINFHDNSADIVHEMFIAITKESYIPPHRHKGKTESFHVVEGSVDVVIFDDVGEILDVIELGAKIGKRRQYYRMSEAYYHTLIIRSDILVVHEVTNGPFVADDVCVADFSPPQDDKLGVYHYMRKLECRVDSFLGKIK